MKKIEKYGRKINIIKSKKGITLIALVITIVILLILAGVSIDLTLSNTGVLTNAGRAKKESTIADERSNIQLGAGAAYMKGNGVITNNRTGLGNYDGNLDTELSNQLGKESTATEIGDWNISGNGPWTVTIEETKHTYKIENDGTVIDNKSKEEVTDENPGTLVGDGTSSNPFLIESIEDLVTFANNINTGITTYENQYIKLMKNLDFQYEYSYALPSSILAGGLRDKLLSGEGFATIGNYSYYTVDTSDGYVYSDVTVPYCFKGNFDGNGKEIINLYVSREQANTKSVISDTKYAWETNNVTSSFFGINYGNISNLILRDSNIYGNRYVSPVVGENYGTISNVKICSLNFSLECMGYLGGIAALNSGTIDNCTLEDNVNLLYPERNPAYFVGGITAQNNEGVGIIQNCCNKANITLDVAQTTDNYSQCAGIAGENRNIITNCCNLGTITQKGMRAYTGGICGWMDSNGTIEKSYNSGKIIANGSYCPRVGGITGVAEQCKILDCYNTGDVTVIEKSKYTKVGGIAGENRTKVDITNCYNTGIISGVGTGYVYIAAIAAACQTNVPTITNCYYLDTSHPNLYGTAKPVVVNSGSKTMEIMKSKNPVDFLDLINENSAYKIDTNNINNGYPILNWQN